MCAETLVEFEYMKVMKQKKKIFVKKLMVWKWERGNNIGK